MGEEKSQSGKGDPEGSQPLGLTPGKEEPDCRKPAVHRPEKNQVERVTLRVKQVTDKTQSGKGKEERITWLPKKAAAIYRTGFSLACSSSTIRPSSRHARSNDRKDPTMATPRSRIRDGAANGSVDVQTAGEQCSIEYSHEFCGTRKPSISVGLTGEAAAPY